MADREWFCVETPDGQRIPVDGQSLEAPNREMAEARCLEVAPRYDKPLIVVQYTRTELCAMEREVTVKERALPLQDAARA